MWLVPISIAIISLIPLLLIQVFSRIDNTIDIALTKRGIAIIVLSSVLIVTIRFMLYSSVGCEPYIQDILHMDIMFAYLMFMSYTDQKTKLLYTSVSVIMIIVEAVACLVQLKSIFELSNMLTWTVGIIPIVLLIISAFRGIGLGDVYIYVVLCLYTLQISHVPTLIMILNLLITNILFIISTIFLKVVKKNKDKHLPLTVYIMISFIACSIIFINF